MLTIRPLSGLGPMMTQSAQCIQFSGSFFTPCPEKLDIEIMPNRVVIMLMQQQSGQCDPTSLSFQKKYVNHSIETPKINVYRCV